MIVNFELQLKQINDISDEILGQLDGKEIDTLADQKKAIDVPQSELFISGEITANFSTYLDCLSISNDLRKKLNSLFQQKLCHLRDYIKSQLMTIWFIFDDRIELEPQENTRLQEKMKRVLEEALEEHSTKLMNAMTSAVSEKIVTFNDAVAQSDMESSSESSVAQKGHSPRAIAILEKVFAQTTNINRSEKLQLARATRLEPRQVTIWFQNRRNRKPTNHAQSEIKLEKKSVTLTQQRKRKFDDVNDEVPHTPIQRRRLSDSDAASLASPNHRRHETPLSTSSCERSSSVDLFENSQSAHSNGGTSCGTSYDDSFSSYQNSSPPRSLYGLNSFDDQVVRFTNAKKRGRSGDDKKEMMFNENGEVLLDWDDLELNLEDFNDSTSHAVTPDITFQTNKQYIGASADVVLPKSKEETNDLIMSFARKLVEEHFNAQQGLQQVQQSEGWQSPVFDKIFLAKEAEQDVISLAELQSSQNSNPSGPSTSNSAQTSPRSGTPKSLFNFDFDGLGLDDIMQYNNESIEQEIDSIDLFAADELIKFDPLTSDALGLICSSQPASPSTATNNGTSSLTLLQ